MAQDSLVPLPTAWPLTAPALTANRHLPDAHEAAFFLRLGVAGPMPAHLQLPRNSAMDNPELAASPEAGEAVLVASPDTPDTPDSAIQQTYKHDEKASPEVVTEPDHAVPVTDQSAMPEESIVPLPTAAPLAATPTAAPVMVDRHLPNLPPATQAAAALVQALPSQPDRIEITLSPEDLGPLRFDMRRQGDDLAIVLSAERPETLDLMRRHAPDLLAELKQAGVQGGTLSFGQWADRGQDRAQTAFATRAEADSPPPPPPPTPKRPRSDRGLDLRL